MMKRRSRVHHFFSVWRADEQVFREKRPRVGGDEFTPRPGRRRPPVVWRASRGPRAAPCRCGRRSPVCASSSRSTACAGSAAPSSPPRTRRQGRPAKKKQRKTKILSEQDVHGFFFSFLFFKSLFDSHSPTCLLAKMSRRASRSSFSVSSLASSL